VGQRHHHQGQQVMLEEEESSSGGWNDEQGRGKKGRRSRRRRAATIWPRCLGCCPLLQHATQEGWRRGGGSIVSSSLVLTGRQPKRSSAVGGGPAMYAGKPTRHSRKGRGDGINKHLDNLVATSMTITTGPPPPCPPNPTIVGNRLVGGGYRGEVGECHLQSAILTRYKWDHQAPGAWWYRHLHWHFNFCQNNVH
jgi:hypothetical protein